MRSFMFDIHQGDMTRSKVILTFTCLKMYIARSGDTSGSRTTLFIFYLFCSLVCQRVWSRMRIPHTPTPCLEKWHTPFIYFIFLLFFEEKKVLESPPPLFRADVTSRPVSNCKPFPWKNPAYATGWGIGQPDWCSFHGSCNQEEGAVIAHWINLWALDHEVSGSNPHEFAAVPMGKALYPYCLVPQRRLKTICHLVADV